MSILKSRKCVIQHQKAQAAVKYYNFLNELFLHYQMQYHKAWYDNSDVVRAKLNTRILRKNPTTNYLEVNFHPSIYQLIREGEAMQKLGLSNFLSFFNELFLNFFAFRKSQIYQTFAKS